MASHRDITGNLGAKALLERLTDDEKRQAGDVLDYLSAHAADGASGIMFEGSIASLLNKQSPNVREAFSTLSNLLETPRIAPFTPKMDTRAHAAALDLDPDQTERIKDTLDAQYVAGTLQQRMGTDNDREPDPIGTRDILSASYDAHTQGE